MTTGLAGWLVILSAGLVWEAVAIKLDSKEWPTLTRVIEDHVPRWLIAASLGWLVFHFFRP